MDTQEFEVTTETATNSGKGRYVWKKFEEDHLIRCMTNEYSDKWSVENGFRPGFFTLLANELKKVMPDTAIRATPHIVSKVRSWKTTYNRINDIVSRSGFGWNDVNKCVVVDEPSVWEEYEKANPKCKGYNGKPFPYYDSWVILFGKDRATGEFAEDFTEMAAGDPPIVVEDDYVVGEEPIQMFFTEDGELGSQPFTPLRPTPRSSTPSESSPRTSTPRPSTPRTSTPQTPTPHPSIPVNIPSANAEGKKVRKRSRMGMEDEKFQKGMNNWMNSTATHMADMAKSMGFPREVLARRERIPDELAKLDLTIVQQFKLIAIICETNLRVDQFYGIKEESKQQWVEAILDGQIYPRTT